MDTEDIMKTISLLEGWKATYYVLNSSYIFYYVEE